MHGVSRLERPGPGINITFASVHHDMAATAALVSTTRLIQEFFFLNIFYVLRVIDKYNDYSGYDYYYYFPIFGLGCDGHP